jgi:hypothetical protein
VIAAHDKRTGVGHSLAVGGETCVPQTDHSPTMHPVGLTIPV